MKRLTDKKVLDEMSKLPKAYAFSTEELIYKKLGELENAEELCEKIGNQPIYKKGPANIIYKEDYSKDCCFTILYNFSTKCIEITAHENKDILPISKYGLTWAFNKEELV